MTQNYKGISFPFRFGSNGGVRTSTLTSEDFNRIYESIYQILFTYQKERINNVTLGSRLKEYLFEPYDDINTLALIKYEVEKSISEQERRVEVLDVAVSASKEEEGKILINVSVLVIQFATETTLAYEFSQVQNNT